MKLKIYYIFLLSAIFSGCNNERVVDNFLSKLEKNQSYLFFRGTDSKEGVVSSNFSIYDNSLSHVGIGLFENDEWNIYNVVNTNTDNDFVIETLDTFYNKETLNINSIEIFKIRLNEDELEKVKKNVLQYSTRKIVFNKRFETGDNTKLYCSEFVVKILNEVNANKFYYNKQRTKLPKLYSKLLGKDSLNYFAVDTFICDPNLTVIYKSSF